MTRACVAVFLAAACLAGGARAQAPARASFEFAQLRSSVQPGDAIGSAHAGVFCGGDTQVHASLLVEQTANVNARFAFDKMAKALDVPVFRREVSPFDTETTTGADYRVGGVLQHLHVDYCDDGDKRKGRVEVEVKWEVFSEREQRVVLAQVVEGEYHTDEYVSGPLDVRAYVNAMHLFLASDGFKALVTGPAAR